MSNLRYSDYYDVKDRAERVEKLLGGSSARALIDAERRAAIHAVTQAEEMKGCTVRVTCTTADSFLIAFAATYSIVRVRGLLLKGNLESGVIELLNGSAIKFQLEGVKEGKA